MSTQVDGCRGVGDYLDKRTVPAAGSAKKCVKTAAYLDRRTLPSPETGAPAGASLTYDYAWNADGSVASRARTITAPDGATDATEQSYDYDDLARLIESATAGGETSRYGYDAAGNRTGWAIGDRSVTASLDAAGRVTSTSDGASYTYDAAGSRSSAVVDGERTTFAHDSAGRLTGTSTQDRAIAFAYDGLNRRVGSSDTEAFGTDESTRAWDGLLPVGGASSRHGASSLLRDAAGDALVQSGASGVSWLLGDARDVTATATSGGALDDLASYGDFGGATFETSGWDAAVGYDGQPGDASLGLDEYFARSYDPTAGSWLEADSWHGELGDPQSLNRYAYVKNSPLSFADAFGFVRTRVGGGSGSRQSAYRSEARNEEIRFRNRVNAHRSAIGRTTVGSPTISTGRFGGLVPRAAANQPRSRSEGLQPLRHLQTRTGCAASDWSCRVDAGNETHCSGAGRFRTCRQNGGPGQFSYSYTKFWKIAELSAATPVSAMNVFKRNPEAIFPFVVEGCPKFKQGVECILHTDRINIDGYMPVPLNARGVVGVDTTRTSVKFTVLDRGYFDAPGSTITFSTERRADGIYLVQDAVGHGTNGVTILGVFALRGSDTAWSLQSAALAQLLKEGAR